MTYSLAACDLDTGEWGVAVASKFLAVGAVVPWARAEVGAVATQALANLNYGPGGLALLQSGRAATDTVQTLTAADQLAHERQVGVVDAQGRAAAYTGAACLDWAGHRTGPGYAAQGNLLAGEAVVDALAETFEGTSGPFGERLLAALAAGDAAGGDRRGRQSACVIVRRMGGGHGGDNDLAIDLRVDDHPDPVAELQRLYALHDLMFGTTPEDELIPLEEVESEVAQRLGMLGFHGTPTEALNAWADIENLEERLYEGRIDPVVLRLLRRESDASNA